MGPLLGNRTGTPKRLRPLRRTCRRTKAAPRADVDALSIPVRLAVPAQAGLSLKPALAEHLRLARAPQQTAVAETDSTAQGLPCVAFGRSAFAHLGSMPLSLAIFSDA